MSLFKSTINEGLGLDIGTNNIKAVWLKKSRNLVRLMAYNILPIDSSTFAKNSIAKKINPINLQFSSINKLDMSVALYNKWHQRWIELGGKKMIAWDICHFE